MRILANNGVGYLASFRNGRIDSPVWFGMVGEPVVAQSFLYGQLNKKGKLTGDDIAYIYPDYLTALVGKFEDKTMKSGRESKIVQVITFCCKKAGPSHKYKILFRIHKMAELYITIC
jgi:hypothetical protein